MLKDQLKVELKRWEHQFIDEHGRGPRKEDIKRLPEIKEMYKKYAALRNKTKTDGEVIKKPNSQIRSSDEAHKTAKVELGPTPQIYGKAMSIFDMMISPTKTPMVENYVQLQNTKQNDQVSPASTIPEAESDFFLTEQSSEVKRQLTFDPSSLSPAKTSHYYGPNSPLKWDKESLQISIKHQSPLKRTPHKLHSQTSALASFSPSPLIKRPLTRSLLELMKEHEAIVEEFENEAKNEDAFVTSQEPDNIFTQDDDSMMDEKKTVKTKKRRVLRRQADSVDEILVKKDISQELLKLKRQRVNEFLGLDQASDDQTGEPNPTEAQEEPEENGTTQKSVKKRKKKFNLVSNNFRRLKLPKKNGANRRWNNRRR